MNSGIRRIGVLSQYKSQTLQTHLQRGWSFLPGELGEFVELLPPQQRVDERWYRGTADALYQNLATIHRHAPERVLVLAGDHVYRADYARMLRLHVASEARASVGCIDVPLADATRFGVIDIDTDERVVRFDEKPTEPRPMPGNPGRALASMGIYLFDTDFLIECLERDAADRHSSHDFGHDILPLLARSGEVYAYPWSELERSGYWRDVGTLDTYHAAHMELLASPPAFDLHDPRWPILTAQTPLPPARFAVAGGRLGIAVESLVGGGSVIAGARVRRSVLFERVEIGPGSRVEESLLLPDVSIGARCHVRRAVVEQDTVLPEGTSVGIDARADRERFHVTDGGITIVRADMFESRDRRPRRPRRSRRARTASEA